jgi:Zn-dependent protease with chaperone function
MIGLVALLLVFAPSLAHLLGVGTDHCHAHGHHAHLCLVHTPFFTGGLLEQMILGGTGVAVLGHVLTVGWRFGRGRRAVRTLLALGEASAATAPYRIVDSQLPFAVTAGLLRPRVFVSNRLLHDLSPSELATVLRHEQAHQRRRDGTRFFTAEVFSALHLRPTRRRILDALGAWPFAGLIVAAGLATSEWWHHSAETLFAFWLG